RGRTLGSGRAVAVPRSVRSRAGHSPVRTPPSREAWNREHRHVSPPSYPPAKSSLIRCTSDPGINTTSGACRGPTSTAYIYGWPVTVPLRRIGGASIPRLEAWTESTSAPGLRLEPLDELSHLRVRGLELGEPPRVGQRLSRIGLLARVGDQRSERLAIVRMAREHAQERFHRLPRPSRPVQRHRVHISVTRALGGQARRCFQLRQRFGHALLPYEEQSEGVMRRGAPRVALDRGPQDTLPLHVPAGGSVEVGEVHCRRDEARVALQHHLQRLLAFAGLPL